MLNNNNLKNQNEEFRNFFELDTNGNLTTNYPIVGTSLTVDTINADQENINNRTDYNITGFLHATGDVIANYGQPNEFSLTQIGEDLQLIDPSKTQNLTAVSRISQFDGKLNIQGTQPSKFISADPDGLNNYGFPELKVGRNVGGCVFTDYLVSEFCNTGTINSQNINNTNEINTNSSLNIGISGTSGIFTVKNSDNINIFSVSNLGVSAPTLNASFKNVLVKGAFRTENETGQTVLNVDTLGNITCNSIIFPGDYQISSSNASLPATSVQALNVSADKTIINNNGLTTKTNLSVSGVSYLNQLNVSSTSLFNNAVSCLSSLNVSGASNFESLNLTGSIYGEGNLQILGETTLDGLLNANSGLNVSGTTTLNGNLIVNGSTITANSQINIYDYIQINQNPASSIPAVKINQGQGSGAIMEILDTDSNIKLSVNQDCDINLNNVFTVDSLTGDIGAGGGNFGGNVIIGTGNDKIVLHQNTKIIDCVDIHTGTFPSGLNTAISGKFNQPTGTTSQYIRGDGSLNTFPTLGGMASLNIVNNKTIYVSANTGNDANNGQSEQNAVATITQAVNLVDGSGWQIAVFPGTYNEAVNISKLNLSILGVNRESGGLINCPNSWTISNASSSVRLYGFSISTVNHTGSGALYIEGCKVNTSLNSSGSGYLQVYNSDLQGSSLTGQVNITGSNIKVIANGSACGILTVNNASAQVSLNNLLTSSYITLTNGVLGIGNSAVYSSGSTTNAITATAGVLILDNVSTLTPLGAVARIGISAGVSYSIRGCVFDRLNSSILGTSTNQEKLFDRLRATTARFDATLNCNNIAFGKDVATNGSVMDFGDSSQSIIIPKGTTGQQPTGVSGMLRFNTTNNQFEGYTTSWGQIGGSSFNPIITSVALGDNLYYDGSSWVNGYYIVAPTCQFSGSGRTISFTGSLTSPFNITESGRQYQAFNDAGLTSLANDSGLLASGATRNYTGILTPGNTYYFRGRFKGNYGSNYSPWSSVLPYTIPTVITPVAIWANFQNNAPTTSDQFGGGFYSQPSPATQSALLNLINGNGTTSEFIYLYNSSGGQPARLVLDYGTSVTFSSSTVQGQYRTVDSASAGGYTPNYCNGQIIEYWNGSSWITVYTLPSSYPSSGSWITTNFTFTTFTARYVSLKAISSGSMTTMLKLYNG